MKLAMVFPGQGSQSVGMMAGFDRASAVRQTFAEACAALGEDLWALVDRRPGRKSSTRRVNTQPVMLTADVALYRAWRAAGGRDAGSRRRPQPRRIRGAGRCRARSRSRDALPLVRFRAQAMQEAVPAGIGAMAAVDGPRRREHLAAACAEAAQGQVVEPVNFNAPGQIVIAGHREAVERAIALAKTRGAKRGRAAAGQRAVPQLAAEARGRAARATSRQGRRCARRRFRSLHNVDVASAATPDADPRCAGARRQRARCAGPTRCAPSPRSGVTHVVECGPGGRCLPDSSQAHGARARRTRSTDDGDALGGAR